MRSYTPAITITPQKVTLFMGADSWVSIVVDREQFDKLPGEENLLPGDSAGCRPMWWKDVAPSAKVYTYDPPALPWSRG